MAGSGSRPFQVGDPENQQVQVLQGLKEGDTVVLNPPAGLKDGDRVQASGSPS
jgi:multidrug efflux pump subunit AcrA (membrane-fusion protein)